MGNKNENGNKNRNKIKTDRFQEGCICIVFVLLPDGSWPTNHPEKSNGKIKIKMKTTK